MSFVKFIKDHPAGIKKGRIVEVEPSQGATYISEKYAEKATQEDYDKFKEGFKGTSGTPLKVLKQRSKDIRNTVNGEAKGGRANSQAPRSEGKEES